ncbi:hypothetical protein bcgnr5372_27480 [Bacillus luti]|nr:hypothetical protein [Bacillus cereus]HDR8330583.1 hypothetical protein [Bacillus cereus]HDR8338416.1 hypothetical protein [Bacillus cereus]
MKDIIKTVVQTSKLYRQPTRIGEVIEKENIHWLVIGIQDVKIEFDRLEIRYVCQNLDKDLVYQPPLPKGDELREFETRIKTGKEHVLERIGLGRLFWYNNMPFQSVEYTDVEVQFTDVVVSFLGRPIRPVARKEAKARLLSEKKKKLNLTLL